MVLVSLSLDGNNKTTVQLDPDNIYRIGSRLGLEFYSDDKSMELAHATIAFLTGGIVRLAAQAGKIFVNDQETEIKNINVSDAINSCVDLRFGNVKAKLNFKDVDNEASHDSSGFDDGVKDKSADTTIDSIIIPETGAIDKLPDTSTESLILPETGVNDKAADTSIESLMMPENGINDKSVDTTTDSLNIPEIGAKDKSADTTTDSLIIPETEPPTANTTGAEESFIIPETQAVCFNRPSRASRALDESKVSLGEDFLIPETQDILIHNTNPVMVRQEQASEDDDGSELGTQIRICTQEYNEYNAEDAIDDFDSSLLMGDVELAAMPTAAQAEDNVGFDLDMSDLNWSSSNTKCNALNSNKSEDDLAAAVQRSQAMDNVPCTPDLFDLLDGGANERMGSVTPDLDVPEAVLSNTSNQNDVDTQKPSAASIETPEASPAKMCSKSKPIENDDNMQDVIATQAFVRPKLSVAANSNEDFIATQAFPRKKLTSPIASPQLNETVERLGSCTPELVDLPTATAVDNPQLCIARQPVVACIIETPENTQTEPEDNLEDFIETQAFPKRNATSTLPKPTLALSKTNSALLKPTENDDNMQDFIATQAFVKPNHLQLSDSEDSNEDSNETNVFTINTSFRVPAAKSKLNSTANDSQDFIATQAFIKPSGVSTPKLRKSDCKNLTTTAIIHNTTEDMMETQLFVRPRDKEKEAERLFITDSISIHDELDEELKQLIALADMPCSPPTDSEELNRLKISPPAVQTKEQHGKGNENDDPSNKTEQCPTKEPQIETVNKPAKAAVSSVRKRIAPRSESPQPLPSKKNRTRLRSEPPSPRGSVKVEVKTPAIACRTRMKRPLGQKHTEPTEPPKKTSAKTTPELELSSDFELNSSSESSTKRSKLKVLVKKENLKLIQKTEKPNNEAQAKAISAKKRQDQLENDNEVASGSKEKKARTSKQKDKPIINDRKLSLRARTESHSEDDGNKAKGNEKNASNTPVEELNSTTRVAQPAAATRVAKAAAAAKLAKAAVATVVDKGSTGVVKVAGSTGVVKVAGSTGEDKAASSTGVAKTGGSRKRKDEINLSETAVVEKATNSRKTSVKVTAKAKEEEKPTSSTKVAKAAGSRKRNNEKIPSGAPAEVEKATNSRKTSEKVTAKAKEEEEPTSSTKVAKAAGSRKTKSETNPSEIAAVEKATNSRKTSDKVTAKANEEEELKGSIKAAKASGSRKKDETKLSEAAVKAKEEEPSSSKTRKTIGRRSKLPIDDAVKDINGYIKKIKIAGRKVQVAMSMCNNAEHIEVLKAVGNVVEVTNDPTACDLLIMDRGERTYKFLVGVAANKPILSTRWLYAIKKTSTITVHSDHMFKDDKFELLFKFNPLSTFAYPSLLKGIDFMLGADIQPSTANMKDIIVSAGGTVHIKPPPIACSLRLYVVAGSLKNHICQLLRNYTNVKYIKTEGVMQAVVQHNVELLDDHRLKN